MEDVKIECANFEDIQGVCDLMDEVGNYHSEALPHIFTNGSHRDQKEVIDLLNSENSTIYVARINDEVVGIAIGIIKESYDHPVLVKRKYGLVDAMSVKAEFRNKGIGSKLLNALHNWFLEKDIKTVELNVWEFNKPAIKLYEKLGYLTQKRSMSVNLEK